jgi:NADPH:quinone reductase-like Zn-dependent oxidoreductase
LHPQKKRCNNGIDALKLNHRPQTKPAANQVLIKIHVVSLNYRDLLVSQWAYSAAQKNPVIPTSDRAGEVVAVGEGVTREN